MRRRERLPLTRAARLAAALVGLGACDGSGEPVRVHVAEPNIEVPAPSDRGPTCADVGAARACWSAPGAESVEGTSRVPMPAPSGALPEAGHRCWGAGRERRCEDRARRAGPFTCDGDRCVQRHPRRPDDGEWECVELAGAAICTRGTAPAGVVEGPADVGWICGERRGHAGERVCVDLSPDRPNGDRSGWSCAFERNVTSARSCVRDGKTVRLGDACASAPECPAGATCVGGSCLPPRPEPACWVDPDCGAGQVCRFGSCVAGG